MAEKVQKRGSQNLQEAQSKLLAGQVKPETRAKPGLRLWLESCPFTAVSLQILSHETMAELIEWASQARRLYSEELQSLLGLSPTEKPPWLDGLHKIARYRFAIKSMVRLAAKQPEDLASIRIREVKAPKSRPFFLSNNPFSLSDKKAPLLAAVENLVGEDSGMTMERLEKRFSPQDPEVLLRKACRLNLTLHAEMQLVGFYEDDPGSVPRMPFIGTSKKACFHCHEYLLRHPLRLQVSACHQKIYPSWMPPPYYPVPGRFKSTPFVELSKSIEQLTKRELKTALTTPRRPKNQDSTAGPSLTMTT